MRWLWEDALTRTKQMIRIEVLLHLHHLFPKRSILCLPILLGHLNHPDGVVRSSQSAAPFKEQPIAGNDLGDGLWMRSNCVQHIKPEKGLSLRKA